MSKDISADCVFRSYKDALEAGLFTAKPYDVFDKDVCAVGFSCPWPYHSLSMLTCTSLAISQHYFSKLGRHDQHTGRPDISCWYPFLHLKLVQTTTFISFTLILHYIGANSWLRGLCGRVQPAVSSILHVSFSRSYQLLLIWLVYQGANLSLMVLPTRSYFTAAAHTIAPMQLIYCRLLPILWTSNPALSGSQLLSRIFTEWRSTVFSAVQPWFQSI